MQAAAQQTWHIAQNHIRSALGPETFNLWFAPLRARAQNNSSLVLEVGDNFSEGWLKDNYGGVLKEAVAHASGRQLEIQFEVNPAAQSKCPAAATPPAPAPPEPSPPRSGPAAHAQFNPTNNFSTFVVGSNNNFAHAAALAVAQSPGKAYNPLFLYGGVGLGKTHLLHAIGHHVMMAKKGARVAYVSSERFTNEYIEGIQNNQLGKFRARYRQSDVVLIDDVQFLAGKERIQEEFFHTFNALHEARKQIVLTCDRPAGDIQNLEQRLVSRFEWGLVTDLQPPDVEMRLAILRKKAQILGLELPDEIISFLATRIRTNIRRLEGALIRVASFSTLTGARLNVEIVEGLLREILHEEGRQSISVEAIQKKVAEHFDLRLADMTGKRRPENIAFPRQIAMFLSRQLTQMSLGAIGESFGGRDHGTVLHACRAVKDRMETDSQVRQVVQKLELQLTR
ncbi:MAG TPA: chromosomal replication initiator protein DnaA [Verrucomicrobiae bacterium]|nr:chromosomal replication initiator protein DnaA [Verrucomicrobiae bacterium]